jgi:hypothetical protein
MQEMRTRYGVPGKIERPAATRVRELRFDEYREGLLDLRCQVRPVLNFKLSDRNLPAGLT